MKAYTLQMQPLILSAAIPLLLCFGSVIVCANGKSTTRDTVFKAYEYAKISRYDNAPEDNQFVYSYRHPTLAEVDNIMVAVVEARYKSHLSGYYAEVVAMYSMDQGKTWKKVVAIPYQSLGTYSRSINPVVAVNKRNLLIFAETLESWLYDETNSKSASGDFLQCFLHDSKIGGDPRPKSAVTVSGALELLPRLKSEITRLQITRLYGGFGRGVELNGKAIVPVVFFNNKKEVYASIILSDNNFNPILAKGAVGPGCYESALTKWERKLLMNARTNDGYRKVYESADMGNTWNEALGSLSRVWGNTPSRKGYGSSASLITVTIENTPVMLFSYPLNTKGGENRDKLNLWLTDNKRVYNVGQISADGEKTGHSSLLYTKGSLYCLYEKQRHDKDNHYSSVLAHLEDELENITAVVKKWKNQDNAFSESCDGKDSSPSYPGSTCEVHLPQKGLVGFLSNESTMTHWKDAYSCVDAEITHGEKDKNGMKFKESGAGAMWPVGRQGQNQRYHFMNHEFTLAATMIIHECKDPSSTPLLSVLLDTTNKSKLMEIECTNNGKLSFLKDGQKNEQLSFSKNKPIRVVFTFQGGITKLYIDGKLINEKKHTFTSGLLSTPISHICILQCESSKSKQETHVTVKNVLLYNLVLSPQEIQLLYLKNVTSSPPAIPKKTKKTKTPSITLSTTATWSKSLSYTGTQSHSLSHTSSQSQSLSHTGTLSQSLSHTGTESHSLSHTESQSQSLSHTGTESQSLSHTESQSESLSHTHDSIEGGSRKGMTQDSSLKKDQDKYSEDQPNSSESTQHPLNTSYKVCPSITVETFPAGDLTQKDIDGTNNEKRILLFSLPKQFYWSENGDVISLSFLGGSGTEQTNGFSGKWGEMLQNATWRRNTTNPHSVLEVEIPTYRDYYIEFDEEILISVDAKALRGDCEGRINGSFIVITKQASQIVKNTKILNSVIAGTATATIFFAGGVGSILEIQALSFLSRMNCASKEERLGLNLLKYFTSVFAQSHSLWIVLGNTLIFIIFGSFHYVVTLLYKQVKKVDLPTACAQIFFPSLTYFVAYIMHIGILVHSVSLLFMKNSEWNHYFLGTVGTLYGLIFPFFVIYYVARHIKVQFVPYKQFINQSCLKRCLAPIGYWTPRNQAKMYGSIFFTMKGGYLYWCVFHLSVVCIAGIVTAIPISTENCHIQYFCLMGIFLFGSIATAVANMMRSVFLTFMHTLSFLILAIFCCIGGLNHMLPSETLFNAYSLLALMVLNLMFIISIYNAIIVVYEWM